VSTLPALPVLLLNALSTSPWMAAGKAHYSSLVLPVVAIAAAAALGRLRPNPQLQHLAIGALVVTSIAGYVREGAGPLGGNYAPATLTDHATRAARIASSLPVEAAVSASTSLVPRLIQRSRIYVFPAVLDADFIFLDLTASPAPTSAGDVFLRVHALLDDGGWGVVESDDGLLLLRRGSSGALAMSTLSPAAGSELAPPTLLSAQLVPSPDGAIDIDGPRWMLRTTWQADRPLPVGTRVEFTIDLQTGEPLYVWDIAGLWWNAPEAWPVGQPITVDVPDVPIRSFKSFSAMWTTA
jgi:hypothetical protein